ncbi:MAG: hypothetical protein EB090_06375 [Verrucomicrobia bacterium]|nr:hypothetical protein [Verrucomicrobiota bacterium]
MIMNKVLPSKMEALKPWAEKAFERMGLPVLGMIPYLGELRRPTLAQVCEELGGEFLCGESLKRRRVRSVAVGAMTAARLKDQLEAGALLITPGDREDLLMAAMEIQSQAGVESKFIGIVLTDGLRPQSGLLRLMGERGLPVVAAAGDSYAVTAKIERMTVKTDPGDEEKIRVIQQVVSKHVDLKAIAPRSAGGKKAGAGS